MDARGLSHQTLEELREWVVERVRQGISPSQIAHTMGFSVRSVFRWMQQVREEGPAALKAKPIPGRPPKLSEEQGHRLVEIVRTHTPYDYGFDSFLWTARLVEAVMEKELGVSMHPSKLTATLHRLGLAPRKPLYRAYEQNNKAVLRWKKKDYPALKARVRKERATLYFMDETGVRTTEHGGGTWSEKGVRPVVETTGQNVGVNLLSALSPTGAMRYMVFAGNFNTDAFVTFLDRLARGSSQKVYLVLDHHPVHKSAGTRKKVKDLKGKVELIFLPEYAPQTNPDEGVWSMMKKEVKRKAVGSKEELREAVQETMRSLAKQPRYLRAIFRNPQFAYVFDSS